MVDLDARGTEHLGVRRVERLGHDQSITGADDRHQHPEQRGLGAGEEVDHVGLDRATRLLRGVAADRVDHVVLAARIGVARATAGDRRLDLGQHGGRRRRVGLADRQNDHVLTGGLAVDGDRVDLPRRVRFVRETEREGGVMGEVRHGDTITGGAQMAAGYGRIEYESGDRIINSYQ